MPGAIPRQRPPPGYKSLHDRQQKELVDLALSVGVVSRADGVR